jgi:signal transduction histidine kinase
VSLIDNKILNLHMQPVWINRLVDIVGFDLQTTMQSRNLRLEIHKEEITEKPTFADSERLYQAVQKILSNAVKYTPDGGAIIIGARELPGFCDLQISDTGIGIAPENLSRIFEKFSSQAEVATHSSGKSKFKGGGPGLGLAIAKGILEAHGGSIWAESGGYDEKALPGSTFHIMIPMRTAPADNPLSELYKDNKATT